ncbi:hypothetical protein C1H46_003611 [Malus baccata]|uniref:Uncharacterized protein n=1 Tax=Malus baccata TaxID=106549 RepID=A0A540NI33_MALBA|nr:hypothetical protein C1H46_003611 [Malus baccata]
MGSVSKRMILTKCQPGDLAGEKNIFSKREGKRPHGSADELTYETTKIKKQNRGTNGIANLSGPACKISGPHYSSGQRPSPQLPSSPTATCRSRSPHLKLNCHNRPDRLTGGIDSIEWFVVWSLPGCFIPLDFDLQINFNLVEVALGLIATVST